LQSVGLLSVILLNIVCSASIILLNVVLSVILFFAIFMIVILMIFISNQRQSQKSGSTQT